MKHGLANPKVGDNATADRLHGAELPRCAADACLGLASRRFDLTRAGTNRHEGWLIYRNALPVNVDESVRRAEVDSDTQATEGAGYHGIPLGEAASQ